MNIFKFLPEGWEKDNFTGNRNIFQGMVEKCDEDYNLHIKMNDGMSGIIPREEVEALNLDENGLPKINLCTGKVHKYVQFKIKEKDGDNYILSRKEAQEEVLNSVKSDLEEGQVVNGIVKNITPYGAFVDIGGGIVKLNIVVKSVDRDLGRINLSYKERFGSWEENANNFKVGMKTKGIIRETEKNKNGIFIELTPNLVGMAEYKEGLNYGEKIDVAIKKIDYDKKKIKLIILN